jgi:signal transduction histidine kinase
MNAAGNRWTFSVHDTGPGLPPALISMLTAPSGTEIEQTNGVNGKHNNSAKSSSGEGIGLFIVKRLCNLLGGQIRVAGKPGEGTLVEIELPLRYKAG